jgi:hypothetical protein
VGAGEDPRPNKKPHGLSSRDEILTRKVRADLAQLIDTQEAREHVSPMRGARFQRGLMQSKYIWSIIELLLTTQSGISASDRISRASTWVRPSAN